jgi:hypothetical protein
MRNWHVMSDPSVTSLKQSTPAPELVPVPEEEPELEELHALSHAVHALAFDEATLVQDAVAFDSHAVAHALSEQSQLSRQLT